jgi:hypothetical protein
MASARKIIDIPMALKILELVETSKHVMDDFFRIHSTVWETRGDSVIQFVSPLITKEAAGIGSDSLKAAFKDMGIEIDSEIFITESRALKGAFRIVVKKELFDELNNIDVIEIYLIKLKNIHENYIEKSYKSGHHMGFLGGHEKMVCSNYMNFNDKIDGLLGMMGYRKMQEASNSSMSP